MEFAKEDVETIIQPLVIYDTSNDGRINVDVPARVADSLNNDDAAKWTMEVTDFSWMFGPVKHDEAANPTSATSDNVERYWTFRLYESLRVLGFGLIMITEQGTEAFDIFPLAGNQTTVSNISNQSWTKAPCLGYVSLSPHVTSERTGTSAEFNRWHSAGPNLLKLNTNGIHLTNRLRLRVIKGFSEQYPTVATQGLLIQQETTGSYRPYHVYNITNMNCSPLFITLKYKRVLPFAMRHLL